jgi:methylmalonyl-CoA mutase
MGTLSCVTHCGAGRGTLQFDYDEIPFRGETMTIAARGNGPGLPSFPEFDWQMPKHVPSAPSGAAKISFMQRIDDTDVAAAAARVRDALAGGAGGVALVFENAINSFGKGLPLGSRTFDELFADVQIGKFAIRVDAHPHSRTSAEMLAAFLARRRADVTRFNLSFGIDPAAIFAGTGGLRMSIEAMEASMPQSLGHFFAMGAPGILLEADGRVFHNAGATPAQELGTMISSAANYLRMFYLARQPLIYAAPHIGFSASVDDNIEESSAKLRAVRLLWARLQEIAGINSQRASVHSETSYGMAAAAHSKVDRAVEAAVAGGADSISLDQARDAAMTTGAPSTHDDRTAELAESGWREFQRLEAEGGVLRSLAAGLLQKRIRGNTADKDGVEITPPVDAAVRCEPLSPLRRN